MPSTATASVAVGAFRHEALFYRGRAEYLGVALPFIEAGLAGGEPVLVAVPAANLELLRAEVGDAGGRVSFADMSQAGRNPGRIIPYVLHAFAGRHAPDAVRILAEPIWHARSGEEYPACVQHEALVNLAFAGRPATIACAYDAVALAPDRLADARRTHPVLVDPAKRWASSAYTEPAALVAAFNEPFGPAPAGAAVLGFDTAGLPAVRQLVAEQAHHAGMAERPTGRFQIAVNEIATNAITHGGGSGVLRMWPGGRHLVAEISGGGQLRDPLAGRIPVPPMQAHGRGLLMVNEVCDLVRVHTSARGTTTRLYLGSPAAG